MIVSQCQCSRWFICGPAGEERMKAPEWKTLPHNERVVSHCCMPFSSLLIQEAERNHARDEHVVRIEFLLANETVAQ